MVYNGISLYEAIKQESELTYQPITCSGRWVSESLVEEIPKWFPKEKAYKSWINQDVFYPEPVLIHAPTGMGKTTFVVNNLVGYAKELGRKVLILGNRLALNMQYKQTLNKKLGNLNVGTRMLEDINTFDNVTLCTYQSLRSFIASNHNIDPPLFIVCDEAHFFCSDAVFNAWTEEILRTIIWRFPCSCRIYMSATPEDVKPVISAAEGLFLRDAHPPMGNYDFSRYMNKGLKAYCFQADYKNLEITFFNKWETIVDTIKSQNNLPRWLIFVSSIDSGNKLKNELTSNVADFINASTNDRDDNAIQTLARRQRFDKKVLICTSVLDNGVSLVDKDLKEIVVDFTDVVEVVQSIGRKRISEDETIHIHVHIPELETIHKHLAAFNNLYETINCFDTDPIKFSYKMWGSLSDKDQKLFRLNVWQNGVSLVSNSLAKYQLGRKSNELEGLYDAMQVDSDAYAKEICNVFGKDFSECMNEDGISLEKVVAGMTEILSEYVEKELSSETDIPEIDKRLQNYWIINKVQSKKFAIKKDSNGRYAEHVNNFIREFNLPFVLSDKRGNSYLLLKKE